MKKELQKEQALKKDPLSIKQRVKKLALDAGFDLVGVASPSPIKKAVSVYKLFLEEGRAGEMSYLKNNLEKRINPKAVLPCSQSLIMLALNYYQPRKPELKGISIYAYGKDYHKVILKKLKVFIGSLKKEFPKERFKAYVDFGPILERAYAVKAGLGFLGKNRALITEEFGSWVFLASVVSTLKLPPDPPKRKNCPEDCQLCIKSCPGKALGEDYFDARKCFSYKTTVKREVVELKTGEKVLWGCDVCQLVCPFNHKSQKLTKEKDFLELALEIPKKYLKRAFFKKICFFFLGC